MNKTDIDYLDYTWNPLAMRCTPVSESCEHCWHLRMANRLNCNPKIPHNIRLAYGGNAPPVLVTQRLDDPLKVKKPSIIGVQFMGDLFSEHVRFNDIQSVLHHMWLAPQHTYLILTKRPEIMMAYGKRNKAENGWTFDRLKNLMLGVTAENQQRADERIPILLQIPAAKRFVSIEPMLGQIDLKPEWLELELQAFGGRGVKAFPRLNWILCGGESGPRARPMHPDWVRSIRDQCQEVGVPFFFKQWGEWGPTYGRRKPEVKLRICRGNEVEPSEYTEENLPKSPFLMFGTRYVVGRFGRKDTGHLLDGQEWREYPK